MSDRGLFVHDVVETPAEEGATCDRCEASLRDRAWIVSYRREGKRYRVCTRCLNESRRAYGALGA